MIGIMASIGPKRAPGPGMHALDATAAQYQLSEIVDVTKKNYSAMD